MRIRLPKVYYRSFRIHLTKGSKERERMRERPRGGERDMRKERERKNERRRDGWMKESIKASKHANKQAIVLLTKHLVLTFQEGTIKVIYAFHEDDPSSDDISKHSKRGAKNIMLLNSRIETPNTPSNPKYFDVINNNVSQTSIHSSQTSIHSS